jgi:hypothetical protein
VVPVLDFTAIVAVAHFSRDYLNKSCQGVGPHSCLGIASTLYPQPHTVSLTSFLWLYSSHTDCTVNPLATVESPWESPPSHSWNCAVTTTFSKSPSQSHHSHSGTPAVPITFLELPCCYSYIHAVNPIATVISYGVKPVSQGLSLPTTYLPSSLSTQHLFNTDIYSTSLHTQANSWLFSAEASILKFGLCTENISETINNHSIPQSRQTQLLFLVFETFSTLFQKTSRIQRIQLENFLICPKPIKYEMY